MKLSEKHSDWNACTHVHHDIPHWLCCSHTSFNNRNRRRRMWFNFHMCLFVYICYDLTTIMILNAAFFYENIKFFSSWNKILPANCIVTAPRVGKASIDNKQLSKSQLWFVYCHFLFKVQRLIQTMDELKHSTWKLIFKFNRIQR